jgi:hypothetical protein
MSQPRLFVYDLVNQLALGELAMFVTQVASLESGILAIIRENEQAAFRLIESFHKGTGQHGYQGGNTRTKGSHNLS